MSIASQVDLSRHAWQAGWPFPGNRFRPQLPWWLQADVVRPTPTQRIPESLGEYLIVQHYRPPITDHQGERRLFLAVLEDALRVLAVFPVAHQVYSETREWFLSDDLQWPASFVNVCDYLGLAVGYIRRGACRMMLQRGRGQKVVVARKRGAKRGAE